MSPFSETFTRHLSFKTPHCNMFKVKLYIKFCVFENYNVPKTLENYIYLSSDVALPSTFCSVKCGILPRKRVLGEVLYETYLFSETAIRKNTF